VHCLKQEPVLGVQDLPLLLEHSDQPSVALSLLHKVTIIDVPFFVCQLCCIDMTLLRRYDT